MRAKAVFTVFGRRLASGKRVYYYQCYDDKGKRQWAKSTGITKKTEAVAYCMKLFRDGVLIPEQKAPTFAEFSAGWWDVETSRYLKWRQLHNPLTNGSIGVHKGNFEKHIKDYFAKYRLDEITANIIEGWVLYLTEKHGNDESKKLKSKTINLIYITLQVMLGEAVRIKLLKSNPCKEVKKLKTEDFKRDILTVDEARKLFPRDWSTVWDNKVVYKAHKLAACTGLRIGELLGLRREYIFADYIFVAGQFTRENYVEHTKTKHNRNVPITLLMRQELEELLQANGDGYVFSENGGKAPVALYKMTRTFNKALESIGISREEKLKRNLSFHAWRHFFNTMLRLSNVADSKVQSVTGHRTMSMTEHYTHFDTRKFSEIRDVQDGLLTFKEPKKAKEKPAKKTGEKKKATA